ncbi:MAG TPA: efflux RND transporter permease subunit [Planctomycetota bacterium]|nr:efflux RND transporter permease subunit [Planctomycetota bacterium]
MWIVQLALRRPYTFVVMSVLIFVVGVVTIQRMATDIFPEIDIPVVAVVWNYAGMSPDEMEQRIIGQFERVLVSTVNDIAHIESQSLNGVGVVKIFLQPGAKIEAATAQITASAQAVLRAMPPGTTPPLVIRYSASNVPIVQVSLGSETLSEQQLFDIAANGLRPGMATVPGAQVPYPYGGRQRQMMIDIDPQKLYGFNLSPADVSNALNLQNLILPGGSAKVGPTEYNVRLNSSPVTVDAIKDLPIKSVNGRTVYIRDVAHVRDGAIPQNNIVDVDGARGVLQPVLKGGSSTLAIVDGVKARMPSLLATLPKDLKATLVGDQSIFVRAAISGVLKEAAIAAGLTALMILMFLGSWRSTVIICISIPLSLLVSVVALALLGQTLNVMTLGGMALAVGILVDDATVEIENVHRNIAMRKPLTQAILDGAQQIAMPAFVSTLCICIVFVPVVFIDGAARSLFTPLAMAVVFAMLTSYFLSRTLVPTMVQYLLGAEIEHEHATHRSLIQRGHDVFNALFDKIRKMYGGWLAWSLDHRALVVAAFVLFVGASCALFPLIGQDFFPTVDAGQIRFHVRAPPGTRIEETERYFAKVENIVHEIIPAEQLKTTVDNIGIPNSGINLALSDGSLMSSADGEVLITLNEEHNPTADYIKALRKTLADKLPEVTVFFQPPDISTQVLNFGLPAPIDIQVTGPRRSLAENLKLAQQISERVAQIPGAVDVHLQQVTNAPEYHVEVDRTMASQFGMTQRDVANGVLVSLSSSGQAAPNYWLDPKNGIQYALAVQTPQYMMNSMEALKDTPLNTSNGPQLLENMAEVTRGTGATNITHYNVAPTFDVLAGVQDQDLGSVSKAVDTILDEFRQSGTLPRGTTITVRGQVESMKTSFNGLAFGLIFAVLLVYLLLVVNFQSWTDPLIILMALPGALAGILWMLFATSTTVSVPALMGAIMSIGTATANSILLVNFANDQRDVGHSALDAAWSAGITRLRPVLMTALAMILGMLPMSLGLGEGGEQNAPLGRAVIGGLACATFATLFFVPVVYSLLRRRAPKLAALNVAE